MNVAPFTAALLVPAAIIYQTTSPAPTTPATATAPAPAGLFGNWRTTGGAVVSTVPCASGLCLRVITLSPDAPGNTDQRNPDANLRNRPICKLEIGNGFSVEGDHASNGHVYDPLSGRTYKATLKLDAPDTLKLRGYIGFSALGRTEIWQRTTITNPCS